MLNVIEVLETETASSFFTSNQFPQFSICSKKITRRCPSFENHGIFSKEKTLKEL